MKKIFTLFVAAVAAVTMSAKTAESGSCGANLTWNFDSGTLTISGTGPMTDYSTDNFAPWFDLKDNIRLLDIKPGITAIGDYAFFGLANVANKVAIPCGVTAIGKYAFDMCVAMPSVYIPYGVKTIGDNAFAVCAALKYVIVPYGVTTIGQNAFAFCTGLKDVSIPATVTTIGDHAFRNCTALEYLLDFASTPQPINAEVFEDVEISQCRLCILVEAEAEYESHPVWKGFYLEARSYHGVTPTDHILSYDFAAGAMTVTGEGSLPDAGNNLYSVAQHPSVLDPRFQVVTLTLSEGLTGIGSYYFSNYWSLTSVTIPEGVAYINTGAFANGYSLRSVTIPRSVEIVGDSVFGGCRSLKTVYNYAVTPQRINGSVFAEVDKSRCTLYVPKGSVPAYRAADVWKDFVIEEMPAQEGVETPSGAPSRGEKVLRNGMLLIERNGKTYNAQGAELR